MNATVEQLAPVEQQATSGWVVAALYQFKEVQDPADLQQRLLDLVKTINLCGTLIVAGEGINGTVAGDRASIDQIHQFLLNEGFVEMEYKESDSSDKPFRKMKIKLNGKEYTVKFGYAPVYKNKIIPRLVGMEQKGEGLEVIDNMLGFLPEFLLVGLQKFHADEFGFDFDDKEAKEKQLAKMYDLLDDYLDPENEEGGDIMSLYNDLSAEMEKNSFLSKMLAKEVQTAKKKPIKK